MLISFGAVYIKRDIGNLGAFTRDGPEQFFDRNSGCDHGCLVQYSLNMLHSV